MTAIASTQHRNEILFHGTSKIDGFNPLLLALSPLLKLHQLA
jgi:hypothetical protein